MLGATVDLADYGIDTRRAGADAALPVLAPGFGHQGARVADAPRLFGSLAAGVDRQRVARCCSAPARDGLADAIDAPRRGGADSHV